MIDNECIYTEKMTERISKYSKVLNVTSGVIYEFLILVLFLYFSNSLKKNLILLV
jgi:hypothetical protein